MIIGERVLTSGRGRHGRIIGFQLIFSAALNPVGAEGPASYGVTQTLKLGRRTIIQPVGLRAVYDPSAYTVSLNLLGNVQFANGGQIVVHAAPPSGITDSFGNALTGRTAFTILPKAQGVVG
jgi:hypothetical protein